MHETVKRTVTFTVVSIATLLLLSLILKPNTNLTFDVLSAAMFIRDSLQSFRPFVIVMFSTKGKLTVMVPALVGDTMSRSPAIINSIKIKEKRLNLTVIYKNEQPMIRVLKYDVIVLPSSDLVIPRSSNFSHKRVVIIYKNGDGLCIEVVPYYNYTLKDEELIVGLFLFKCKFKLRERMYARFLGYAESIAYLRFYGVVGEIKVLLNGLEIIHEYAKVIVLKLYYEVWEIG